MMSSNLPIGICDHNVTSVVRKLTRKRFKNHINVQQYDNKMQKSEQSNYDAAISQFDWSDLLSNEDPESGYSTFLSAIKVDTSFTRTFQRKPRR